MITRALLAALALAGSTGAQAEPRRPHIVLVVADDLGRDLGCYGNPAIRTPHLDRIAAEGTRFDRSYATTASCSASRSVILSGLHNHATAQFDLNLTLAESPEGLRGTLEYSTDLFETSTVGRMASHLRTLLEAVVAEPDRPLLVVDIGAHLTEVVLLTDGAVTDARCAALGTVDLGGNTPATRIADAVATMVTAMLEQDRTSQTLDALRDGVLLAGGGVVSAGAGGGAFAGAGLLRTERITVGRHGSVSFWRLHRLRGFIVEQLRL